MSATLVGLTLAAAMGLTGCESQPPASDGAQAETAAPSPSNADPEIAAALAKLSAEDRAAAEAQVNCPVTDEPLGSMGTPIKVTVKSQDVFLCCEGCRETIEADPDQYLSKLK